MASSCATASSVEAGCLLLGAAGDAAGALLYLSVYLEKHRQQYYDLLLAVSERGEWEVWFLFFLAGVAEQARDAVLRAQAIQNLQGEWLATLEQEGTTGLMVGVTNFLFERPIVTANVVRERFGVVHQTAMKTLRRLEELGIVVSQEGESRSIQFVAARLLGLIE